MSETKITVRMQVLADIIVDQAGTILQQAEQIGRLNEMFQTARQEIEALKKTSEDNS